MDCETQRLTNELGVRLGVGPMPGRGGGADGFRNEKPC